MSIDHSIFFSLFFLVSYRIDVDVLDDDIVVAFTIRHKNIFTGAI